MTASVSGVRRDIQIRPLSYSDSKNRDQKHGGTAKSAIKTGFFPRWPLFPPC